MPIRVRELQSSRTGSSAIDKSTEITLHYRVTGTLLIADVVAAVDAACPTVVYDPVKGEELFRHDIDWDPELIDVDNSDGSWLVHVKYIDAQAHDERRQLDVGEFKISASTTGGMAKILVSKETIESYAAGGLTATDFKQAIGVSKEGGIDGAEIVVPAMKWTVHYRQPRAVITVAYSKLMEEMTGSTNDDVFYARPAGEVLFTGWDGEQAFKGDPTSSYSFIRRPNITDQMIGDIGPIAAKGHEYVWVYYDEEEDEDSGFVRRIPKFAYVERMYDPADFSQLGIGTG